MLNSSPTTGMVVMRIFQPVSHLSYTTRSRAISLLRLYLSLHLNDPILRTRNCASGRGRKSLRRVWCCKRRSYRYRTWSYLGRILRTRGCRWRGECRISGRSIMSLRMTRASCPRIINSRPNLSIRETLSSPPGPFMPFSTPPMFVYSILSPSTVFFHGWHPVVWFRYGCS